MTNKSEALDLERERQAMVERARPHVIEAIKALGKPKFSIGEVVGIMQKLNPEEEMGLVVPSVLDALEDDGKVTCTKEPLVDRAKTGRNDWGAIVYDLLEPLLDDGPKKPAPGFIQTVKEVIKQNPSGFISAVIIDLPLGKGDFAKKE